MLSDSGNKHSLDYQYILMDPLSSYAGIDGQLGLKGHR